MRLRPPPDVARQVGLVLAALSVLAVIVGFSLFVVSGGQLRGSWMLHNLVGGLALAAAFGLMVRKQPTNGAVWALGWSMVFQAIGQVLVLGLVAYGVAARLGQEVVRDDVAYELAQLPAWLVWLHTVADVTWLPAVVVLTTFALLLFPDGRLPSRRWRPVAGLAAFGIAASSIAFGVASHRAQAAGVGNVNIDGPIVAVALVGGVAILLATVLSIASVIVRYRRSSGSERRQIRWIAVGGVVFGSSLLIWLWAVVDLAIVERWFWVVSLISFPILLASYAVAILRYRLYDIDVVISRSLVLAVLAGFIALVYVTVVVGVGQLVGGAEQPRLGLQVVATAIVAVAFQPLRVRARRFADRLVLGQRATPYEVLAGFSRQAANAGDEATLQRVAELLAAGTGAQPAVVWLRVGEHLRPVAVSGGGPVPLSVVLDGERLPEVDASLAVPVHHDGELLGAVTLTKPHSEPPSDQDELLTARLAAGLSLVLRNARLTAELQERLQDLEASRQRIVHAQDEVRRKIERDLRAGAQRHLVELERLLGEAHGEAFRSGAERTAGVLSQLEGELADAIVTLRDLAQGIYPPLLESEGLAAALAERVARSPLPVTLHAAGIGRYGREVEGAVYFCVLEALQNAARYADAGSVHVRLHQQDGNLAFEVADDGVGFDPAATTHGSGLRGIADRLDTVGGDITVESSPGGGTRISGRMPAAGCRSPSPTAAPAMVEV